MPVVLWGHISTNLGIQDTRYWLSSNNQITALPGCPISHKRTGTPYPHFLAGTPRKSGM